MATITQRSMEWRQLRLGDVTASKFACVMSKPKDAAYKVEKSGDIYRVVDLLGNSAYRQHVKRKDADAECKRLNAEYRDRNLSDSAETYLNQLIGEKLCHDNGHDIPGDVFTTPAMEWGIEHEAAAYDRACESLRKVWGEELSLPEGELAYIEHPTEPGIGCSPDGLIGDYGDVELKCPYNIANHARALREQQYPVSQQKLYQRHRFQIQGRLWVTGRTVGVLVSYDPRFDEDTVIQKFPRDETLISDIATAVCRFRDRVAEVYGALSAAEAPF